jgi:hypothetical protein
MLAELGAGVGQLLDAVEELGVAENTSVIVMSDNGGRGGLSAAIDGVSLRPLFDDPAGGTLEPPDRPLFFHRPGKRVSAIRQGRHKLILTWAPDGAIASRALYDLEPNPIEEGRDITADEPDRADRLQALLLAHLEAVDAEGWRP